LEPSSQSLQIKYMQQVAQLKEVKKTWHHLS